jgi:hypothetical protein
MAIFFLINAFLRGELPKDPMAWVLWSLILAAPVASLITLMADNLIQGVSGQLNS